MELKLEDGVLSRIQVPPGARDVLVWDTAQKGFFLRVFASGEAKYGVRYLVAGKQRRVHLADARVKGALALARKEAEVVRAKARLGTDVVADREAAREATKAAAAQKANTLSVVLEDYLQACATRKEPMRPKTLEETGRYLRKHWAPLHKSPIATITRDNVVDRLDDIEEDSGPVAADRARSALSGLYTWAIDKRFVQTTPLLNIKDRARGGGRKRALSESELREVWRAVEAVECSDYERIIKLLILTGQRKTEISALNWNEVDAANAKTASIKLPEARTKNGLAHTIPLVPQALTLLPARRNRTDAVFGQRDTGFSAWSKYKSLLDAEILAARRRTNPNAKPMDCWRVHDLRRSFCTRMREARIADAHLIELIVNHVSGTKAGVAGIYDQSERMEERREALEKWAQHVEMMAE